MISGASNLGAVSDDTPDRDELPIRIADLLEGVATRIREMTVDRVARLVTMLTLGMLAMAMVGIAVIFLLVGLFRIADGLIHRLCDCGSSMEIAYAVVGGLFLLFGWLMWRKRTRKDET